MTPRPLVLLGLLGLLGSGCRNTCDDGATMRNPALAGPLDTATDRNLVIVWDTGRELPSSYFDEVIATPERDIESVTYSGERELTVTFAPGALPPQFTLQFPDRLGFIDCVHPGSDDTYLVHVTLQLSGSVVVDATFREDIILGPI